MPAMTRAVSSIAIAMLCAGSAARAQGSGLRQVETTPQQGSRDETLIGGQLEHGGYGGPRLAYGRIAGHDAVMFGGEGAWIVNHRFLLGGAGFGLVTEQPAPGSLAPTDRLTMGYGGLLLGYTVLPHRVVHGTATLTVGAGGLGARSHMSNSERDLGDAFFVLEPTVNLELNVTRHFRPGLAVSYRWVRGVQTEGLSNGDLSGVFGSIVLKFGSF